jgi:hypothetical protein
MAALVYRNSFLIFMLKKLSLFFLAFTFFGFTNPDERTARYLETKNGLAIEWSPDVKLKWSDFKAKNRVSKSFSVATSTCGFGYDGIVRGDEIILNVYVHFYCYESWKNPDYHMNDVLQHEQLHFDICELYGRKFYKEIQRLKTKNQFNEKSLESLYNSLVKEYDAFQDLYDAETGHSTKTMKQLEWNNRIAAELNLLEGFANYREF